MKTNELIRELEKRNIVTNDKMVEQLETYASFLSWYNEKINLTSIVEHDEIIDKHFYDSLLLVDREIKGTLVDVGTGAGFPGVVLKIVFPELKVILVEPIKKRCVFLEELIKKLELENVEIVNERGEDYSLKNREKFDFVTARAVSNLNSLIEVCGAMIRVDGYFICLRGKDGVQEIEKAKNAIKTMGFVIESIREDRLFDGSKRIISYFKKVEKANKKYPRKYSIIKAHPL